MARFKRFPQKKKEDKVIYGNGIVDGIVYLAMAEVPYTELYSSAPHKKTQSNAIVVKFEKEGLHIDVYVKIHYTQCVSDMAFKIQETVRHSVESMTDYRVNNVNIIVKGVLFEDYENKTVINTQENDDDKKAKVTDSQKSEGEKKAKKTATTSPKSEKNDVKTVSDDGEKK